MRNLMMDAQAAFSFAIQQASRINTKVYERKYPDIRYRGLIPVDTTGPEWVKSVTYMSMDAVGAAEWLDAGADDVPHAELIRDKTETTVQMAGIGYGWNIEELAQANMLGISLPDRKGAAARRASEEKIDKVAFLGDATKGFYGVANHPAVDAATVATGAATGDPTEWEDKDPDEIMEDVNATLSGVWTDTLGVEMADTLLVPPQRIHRLGTRRIDQSNQTTILEWLQTRNVYTVETGQPLTIRGIRGLETAGAGETGRMVAYRNSDEVLRLNMPMPFRFFPVWQNGPFRFEVPGAFRIGGVDVSLPKAIRYADGI